MEGLNGGGVELTWLGQAGFLLSSGAESLLIDPFLSPHELRLFPPPPIELLGKEVDWLLASHEHLDHLDIPILPTLVRRFPRMQVVLPTPLVQRVESILPSDRIHGVQPGDVVTGKTFSIRPVPACHGVTMADAYSNGRKSPDDPTPFLGYVIDFPGLTIYHAGDTILSQEMVDALEPLTIDVALLPVNGRDYFREAAGIVGNLSVREAVQFAAQIGARVLIPMHHDLMRGNTERPGAAAEAAAGLDLPLHVMNPARFKPVRLPALRVAAELAGPRDGG